MNIKEKIKRLVRYRRRENEIHLGEWYTGWHWWHFEISYNECGYEEGWAHLVIAMFGWYNQIQLPFIKSKRFPDGDCDAPRWGIAVHDNTLWVYYGGEGNWGKHKRYRSWYLPWFSSDCVRHDIETKDPATGELRMTPYKVLSEMNTADGRYQPIEENPLTNIHYADFTDKYDGTVLTAAFYVEEREWRRKWFHWTRLGRTLRRSIDIQFSEEVGSRKGSWKGGTVGCGYDLLPGETAEECLKRMERERSFDR